MASKSIAFPNPSGESLSARLDFPPVQKPMAFALFSHCFTCTKHSKAAAQISKSLTGKGIALLRFDFTGLGESEGDFSETNFSSNVADLLAAADFLKKNHQVPKLLIGHSFGGTACLQAAMQIDGVSAVVVIGSPAEPRHVEHLLKPVRQQIMETGEAELLLAERPIRIKKQFIEDLEKVQMNKLLPNLQRALLIMHSPADTVVSIDNAARLYQAAGHPKSFISLDTADHMLSNPEDATYCGRIIAEWATRYISS
jgi:putative redox protein